MDPQSIHMQKTLARLGSMLPSLRPAEQRLARAILEDPQAAIALSVTDLVRRAETSETTAVRLAKALGFKGIREFKLAVATELPGPAVNIYSSLRPGETLNDIATNYFTGVLKAFGDTLSLLDFWQLERAVSLLSAADRIGCFGSGASGHVALDAEQKLLRVGRRAWAFTDPHEQLAFACLLTPQDVVVGISHSGYTRDVLESVGQAKANGARAVIIAGDPRSDLAALGDVVLIAASPEVPLRSGTVISRLAQLAVVDLLSLGLAAQHPEAVMEQLEQRGRILARRRVRS